jgi:alpha-glucosidase
VDTDSPDQVLVFRNSDTVVVTNFGPEPVSLSTLLPGGAKVLHASADLDDDGKVPTDVTVWVATMSR